MAVPPLIETLADLVRINSVNSAYEGGRGEREIATWIGRYFARLGIETWEQEVLPGRPNLIARLPGRDPARRIILEAHMDTASVGGMTIPPFEPRIEEGKLYGRGACDTKGGLAAMMHAIATLAAEKITPPCEVWLAAAADEEHAFAGVTRLAQGLRADAAVVAEPTELRAVIATKGCLRWRIVMHGRAAHSSKPQLGISAINHMARLVLAFEEAGKGLADRVHPLLGSATCNIGLIQGGEQVNFVPGRCIIDIDRRLLPGEKPLEIWAGYQALIDRLQRDHPDLKATMETPTMADEALETPANSAPARAAAAVLSAMALDARPAGVPYGSDASKLSRQGIPSIVFGPGSIDRAHAAVEYVELTQVALAADFYHRFILQFGS